jgi:phosphoribosyl 1,2-cyclic phosphodiesterase
MTRSSPLTVRFRGVRGSIPSPARENIRYGGNTSCVEVRCGDQLLILDAGSGIRCLGDGLVKEFGSRPIAADLLVSHTHWDHIQGLPFFTPAYSPHNRIRIIATNGHATALERALKNQMSPPHFPVGFEQMLGIVGISELISDQADLGNFSIQVTSLNHPGGCAGFRLETNGAAVGYLPDHEPYPRNGEEPFSAIDHRRKALVEFVRDLDLLILDTQYTDEEYKNRVGWGHGFLSASVALAVEAGVHRLALFHHDPSHPDDQIDQMIETAHTLAGNTALAIHAAAENAIITLGGTISPALKSTLRDLPKVAAL